MAGLATGGRSLARSLAQRRGGGCFKPFSLLFFSFLISFLGAIIKDDCDLICCAVLSHFIMFLIIRALPIQSNTQQTLDK